MCLLSTAWVPVSYLFMAKDVYVWMEPNAFSCCCIGMEVWSRGEQEPANIGTKNYDTMHDGYGKGIV